MLSTWSTIGTVAFVCVALSNLGLAAGGRDVRKRHPACSQIDSQSALWLMSPSAIERAEEVRDEDRPHGHYQYTSHGIPSTPERAVEVQHGENIPGPYLHTSQERVVASPVEKRRRRKRDTFCNCHVEIEDVDLGEEYFPRHIFNGTCSSMSLTQCDCVPSKVYEINVLRKVEDPCFKILDPRQQDKEAKVWVEDSKTIVVACELQLLQAVFRPMHD